MVLDTPTLIVAGFLLALVLGAAHYLTWRINRSLVGLRHYAVADLFAAAAFLMVALRGPEPSVWLLLLTNALVAAFQVHLWRALRAFTGQPMPLRPVVALMAAYLLGVLYYSTVEPSVSARIALYSAIGAVMGLLCAKDLLDNIRRQPSAPAKVVCCILFGHAVFNALRSVLLLTHAPLPDVMAPSGVQTLSFLENLLVFMAGGIGFIVMTTERLHQDLRRAATYDALTGILNRRAFLEQAEREVARARRSGVPYSLLVMDIDHFKRVNDTHGHQAGDAVLKAIAEGVAGSLRQVDLFGRFGGEEFCVLLPETRRDAAKVVGERLCRTLAALEVRHDGKTISTSVSIGMAESAPGAEAFDAIVAQADIALYRAKSEGRNRAILHEPDAVVA